MNRTVLIFPAVLTLLALAAAAPVTTPAGAPADSAQAAPEAPATAPAATARPGVESYVYVARPDNGDSTLVETHRVEIEPGDGGTTYRFDITRTGVRETGWARSGRDGNFQAAARRVYHDGRGVVESDSFWVEGEHVVMQKTLDGKTQTTREKIQKKKPLAVDVTLTTWMRGFPFGQKDAVDVVLGDWLARTIDIDVRDLGVEPVKVPAGTFDCHKMEVTIRVLIFRPKVTFWVTKDAPHFLVRHAGKRGRNSPVYVTQLMERGTS